MGEWGLTTDLPLKVCNSVQVKPNLLPLNREIFFCTKVYTRPRIGHFHDCGHYEASTQIEESLAQLHHPTNGSSFQSSFKKHVAKGL